eukprot:Gb_24341 [translate_table: standard]
MGFGKMHEEEVFKRSQAVKKTAPSGAFCMSGPVANVDDDEEEQEFSVIGGEKALRNGDIYLGSWHENLPDGVGKYLWADGCMYEGEWCKGKKTGKGKFSWPSGATYEGEFKGGYMDGFGTYTGVDGATYRGHWVMNEKHGYGQKCYANGDFYEGSWKHGVQDGRGRYVWENGNEYVGDWKRGLMCGRGILTWVSGNKYDGHWLDGFEHGHGVYTWADGSCYVGTWNKDRKDGNGTFYPQLNVSSNSSTPSWDPEKVFTDFDGMVSQKENSSSLLDSKRFVNASYMLSCKTISQNPLGRNTSKHSRHRSRKNANVDASKRSLAEKSFDGLCLWDSDDNAVSAIRDKVDLAYERSGAAALDNTVLSVVEREFDGVLLDEFGKDNAASKEIRRRQKQHPKEAKRPGETIFKGHRNYELMLNLQLGIRYTVGRITPEPTRDICSADFGPKARIWMRFPPEGSKFTPPHQSVDFRWKDYCPMVFRHLRELFKIDAADYMLSICGNDGLRELSSPGKSGSVFYLSHDDRFIIKTMRKSEVKVLLGMLPNYYHHVRTYENTLITKFFGLHSVKTAGGQKVRFIVMGNLLCSEFCIHRRFDLKGSSQGRSTDKVEINETTTLKDLDLDFVFRLEPFWCQALLKQLECDCEFLESQRIMDYSLLLGLHFRDPKHPTIFFAGPSSKHVSDDALNAMPTYDGLGEDKRNCTRSLVFVTQEPDKSGNVALSHALGDLLKPAAVGEADLVIPRTRSKLGMQLGVNMPARAERRPPSSESDSHPEGELFGEVYDVVLYFGIIDILQDYDITKRLEHAYKALQFDSLSISAVDPKLYSKRFQDFLYRIFIEDS